MILLKGVSMEDKEWKTTIYEPYLETWKILKLIQYADQTSDSDNLWKNYMSEIDRLGKQYPNNKFADKLITLLLDAGDVLAKMNRKETET